MLPLFPWNLYYLRFLLCLKSFKAVHIWTLNGAMLINFPGRSPNPRRMSMLRVVCYSLVCLDFFFFKSEFQISDLDGHVIQKGT
jgi:hypothetical protein